MIIITRVNSVEQNVYQRPIWYAVLYKTTCLIVITIISITTGEINEISKPVDGRIWHYYKRPSYDRVRNELFAIERQRNSHILLNPYLIPIYDAYTYLREEQENNFWKSASSLTHNQSDSA